MHAEEAATSYHPNSKKSARQQSAGTGKSGPAFRHFLRRIAVIGAALQLTARRLGQPIIAFFEWAGDQHIFLFASALAFSLLLCIIPLVLILFYLLGKFLDSAAVQFQLNFLINTSIPEAQTAAFVRDMIQSRVHEVIAGHEIAGWIGAAGLLVAASGWFTGLRTVLNVVFKVDSRRHSLLGKLKDFGTVLLILLFFVVSLAILPAIEILKTLTERLPLLSLFGLGLLQKHAVLVVALVIFWLLTFALYYVVPDARLPWKVVAVSALISTVLHELAKRTFAFYLLEFSTWGQLYGTYAVLITLAFWLYVSSLILLLSAQVGQMYRERREAAA